MPGRPKGRMSAYPPGRAPWPYPLRLQGGRVQNGRLLGNQPPDARYANAAQGVGAGYRLHALSLRNAGERSSLEEDIPPSGMTRRTSRWSV